MQYSDEHLRYLRLLSQKYQTVAAAASEIIRIEALLRLPKGTEHFMSDLHGEHEAFVHILNSASGVIREKIDTVLGNGVPAEERAELATLVYYPNQKLPELKARQRDLHAWYRMTLLRLIDGTKVKTGDVLVGIASSGVHSNGFSLVRKVFNIDADPDVLFSTPAELGGKTLGEALLAPTKIYVKPVLKVLEEVQVKGISHITGGGFYENIPRSLKKGCCARINKADVRTPALFHLMQKVGGISEHDMFNTFNMGVGMVLTVPAEQADKALEILHANGEPEAYRLGVIAEGEGVELC